MFDTYADRIVLTRAADAAYVTRAAGHLAAPAGPVHVTGGPCTAKAYHVRRAAVAAGLTPVGAQTAMLHQGSLPVVAARVEAAPGPVVLLVEFQGAEPAPSVAALLPGLRALAAHPKVHATFVLHTV